MSGKYGESIGKARLYVNDKVTAEGPMKTQPGEFEGGKIQFVGVTVEEKQYLDLEKLAPAALAVD
jgi:arylsulfatase